MEPLAENAVENDAGTVEAECGWVMTNVGGALMYGESENLLMRVNESRAPPVIRWRYTSGESPTESSVRPSGEIEAMVNGEMQNDNQRTIPICEG